MKKLFILFLLSPLVAFAQVKDFELKIIPLYQDSIPNSTGFEFQEVVEGAKDDPLTFQKTSEPTLSVYLPAEQKRSRAAIIIFPGGAYSFLAFKQEGSDVARYFAHKGITAIVVKYRLPDDVIMRDISIGALQDAQQAIKVVRSQCSNWGLDSNKIGLMGFSAGGHLAATAATHFEQVLIPNRDNISLRPDFLVLIYPLITMKAGMTHRESREKLLGNYPSDNQVSYFSNELQVTERTPPTWLTHAGDDRVVSVENSIMFYEALRRQRVRAEMHIYPSGDHGFVLKQPYEQWTFPLLSWMNDMGWITNHGDSVYSK